LEKEKLRMNELEGEGRRGLEKEKLRMNE